MTAWQKSLVLLGGGLLLVALLIFILYPLFRREPVVDTTPIISLPPSALIPLPSDNALVDNQPVLGAEANTVLSPVASRAEVERLSRLFVERFGSYSNFSGYENINSLRAFMTPSMAQYADSVIAANSQAAGQAEYVGQTSTLISLRLTDFADQKLATVKVVTQEDRQVGLNGQVDSSYRDGRVELVYGNGQWLVSGLFYN